LSQKDAIAKLIDKNCIVIDVGSTKSRIVAALQRVFPNFVGTHPLAGSEKKGIVFADGSLFDNSLCIITPTKKTSKAALGKVKRLWLQLKTKVAILSPEDHDSILSYTSHLPHAIAFSLIAAIPDKCLKFSAGGLKSSTRISASDAILWKDIFLSNRKNMLKAIKSFESGLTRIKSAINRNNSSALISILTQAKKKRDSLQ
jgi:prephenate dehydrogenase